MRIICRTAANMGDIRFLDFPREIRDLVYKHMFCKKYIPQYCWLPLDTPPPGGLSSRRRRKMQQPTTQHLAILQSSKQVNQEATRIFYLEGQFLLPLLFSLDLDYLSRYLSRYTASSRIKLANLSHVEICLSLNTNRPIKRLSRCWIRLINDIGATNSKSIVCHVNIICESFTPTPTFTIDCRWLKALKSLVGFKEVQVSLNCPAWFFKECHWMDASALQFGAELDACMKDLDWLLGCSLGPGSTFAGSSEPQCPTSRCIRFHPLKYASLASPTQSRMIEQR